MRKGLFRPHVFATWPILRGQGKDYVSEEYCLRMRESYRSCAEILDLQLRCPHILCMILSILSKVVFALLSFGVLRTCGYATQKMGKD